MSRFTEKKESTVATFSPNRPPMPKAVKYTLLVSHSASLWEGAGHIDRIKRTKQPVDQLDVSFNLVLVEVYYSGLSTVDRDVNYFADNLMFYPSIEVIGVIRKRGDLTDKMYQIGDNVACFDVANFGLSNFVVVSDKNLHKIPDPGRRFLYAMSPMVTSFCLFDEQLCIFNPGTKTLVNLGSSGIGSAICQGALEKRHDVYCLDYAEANSYESYYKRKANNNVNVTRVKNLIEQKYRDSVEALTENGRFDIIIMPAITTEDTHGVYKFLLGLLDPRSTSRLVLLCQMSLVEEATLVLHKAKVMTQLGSLGISLSWFFIDNDKIDYYGIVKANLARVSKSEITVFQDEEICESIPDLIVKDVFSGMFRGKYIGQKVVRPLKPPHEVTQRKTLID